MRTARRVTTRGSRRSPTCCARSCCETPPNVIEGSGVGAMREACQRARHGQQPAQARRWTQQRELLDLFTRSAGDILDGWFESDPIKALLRLRRHRRQLRQPVHAGLGLRAAASRVRRGERQEGRLGPRHRRHGRDHAGDGEAPRAAHGVEIRARSRRARGDRREAAARSGVVTDGGESDPRRAVVSNVNPKLLYDTADRPARRCRRRFASASRNWRCGSGTFRMNVALSRAAPFHCLPGAPASTTPPASSWRRASPTWSAPISTRARTAGREPIVEMLIPSTLDDTLAPAGPARREPVLPARRAATARRQVLGRPSRDSRRPDDRDGRPLRAGLQGIGARPADPVAARSRAHVRACRRRHLPRRADARSDVLGAADARPCRLSRAAAGPVSCAVAARIPAAA